MSKNNQQMQQPLLERQQSDMMQQQPDMMHQQPAPMHQQPAQVPAPQPSVTILYTAQGTPVQVVNVNPEEPYKYYQRRKAKKLGIAQIVLGLLIIICQTVVTGIKADGHHVMVGFWASGIFIFAGACGIKSANPKSSSSVIVTMIISIIAAVLAILGVLYTGVMAAQFHYRNFQFCSYDYDEDGKIKDCRNDYSKETYAAVTFFSIMAGLGLIELIVASTASALTCHGCCCRREPKVVVSPELATQQTGMPVAVAYQTNPGDYPVAMATIPMATVDTPAYKGDTTPPPQYQEKA